MARLQLSLCLTRSERTLPIIRGEVQAQGIDFVTTVADPGDIFWRQLKFADFDVSEMSMSSLLMILARGDTRWAALPVFTSRSFYHTQAVVRQDAGIERPEDLRGKRVGVTEYQQTAALWARGALQHEFDVHPEDLEWFMERTPDRSHGGAVGFEPPPGVTLHSIPPSTSLAAMLLSGEIQAAIKYSTYPRSFVNRGYLELRGQPGLRTLFPDPTAEGIRYFRKTGLLPLNHGLVVRRQLLEQHPWLAFNIYTAFEEARQQAARVTRLSVQPYLQLGLLPESTRQTFDADPWRYGLQANRLVLETLAAYSHQQGLTPRPLHLDEIFTPISQQL
jgi:4,5-dihydroxyphthalate decarboxylase